MFIPLQISVPAAQTLAQRGQLVRVALAADVLAIVRTAWMFLATAHRSHDTAKNADVRLAA